MSSFEQSQEIRDFPDVWFLGLEAKKIEAVPGAPQNNGTSLVIIASSTSSTRLQLSFEVSGDSRGSLDNT